jgi:hypothetical protein
MNFKEKFDYVISIDPGKSGAIAVLQFETPERARKLEVHRMGDTISISELMIKTKALGNGFVIIERIGMQTGDIGGKQIRMESLIRNTAEMETIFKIMAIPFIKISPITWQKGLNLRAGIFEEKKDRKNRYKAAANTFFPFLACTLWNSDALCILEYAIRKLANDPNQLSDLFIKTHEKKVKKKRVINKKVLYLPIKL